MIPVYKYHMDQSSSGHFCRSVEHEESNNISLHSQGSTYLKKITCLITKFFFFVLIHHIQFKFFFPKSPCPTLSFTCPGPLGKGYMEPWFSIIYYLMDYKLPPSNGLIYCFNSLRPGLNRRPFADDIFKCIFLNENAWISLEISLKFVRKVQIDNIPALVQIMAWRRPGDKPLSEPMMVSLLTHICVTRPQWVKLQYIFTFKTLYFIQVKNTDIIWLSQINLLIKFSQDNT